MTEAIGIGSAGVIVDGVVTRLMGQHERDGWATALWIAHVYRGDRERVFDRLCELANEAEVKSLRYEQRGYAELAVDQWQLSELFDAAAAGLVR